jgi:hypothetical protein
VTLLGLLAALLLLVWVNVADPSWATNAHAEGNVAVVLVIGVALVLLGKVLGR